MLICCQFNEMCSMYLVLSLWIRYISILHYTQTERMYYCITYSWLLCVKLCSHINYTITGDPHYALVECSGYCIIYSEHNLLMAGIIWDVKMQICVSTDYLLISLGAYSGISFKHAVMIRKFTYSSFQMKKLLYP